MDVPVVSVIMAGGSGERFWPLSRKHYPKQLLPLISEKPMLLEAVNLLHPLISKESVWIATSAPLLDAVQQKLTDHPKQNIIGEPMRRNTTGCLVYAAAQIMARYGNEAHDKVMAITTADHHIPNANRFREVLESVINTAYLNNTLVTIGIQPSRPETGYGYIDVSDQSNCQGKHQTQIYAVNRFVEKPDAAKAQNYIDSGNFYWNSGMFFWKISTFLDELKTHLPIAAEVVERLAVAITEKESHDEISDIFSALPNTSIDYALMEKSNKVEMTVGDFGWDDIGAWDAVSRLRGVDEQGNFTEGSPVTVDCSNVTIINEPGAEHMAVGAVGLSDIIIVTTKDGILVCHKDRAQDVKQITETLKKQDSKFL